MTKLYTRELKNEAEAGCVKALKKIGFRCSKRGWPDFIATRSKTGEFMFVEVKPDQRAMKDSQIRVMRKLSGAGLKCYRWDPIDGLQPFNESDEVWKRTRGDRDDE